MTDIHTLYWEVSGLATGEPVVVLHGGPGGGTDPDYRYIVVTNKVVGLVKLIVQGFIFSLKNHFFPEKYVLFRVLFAKMGKINKSLGKKYEKG